jgi:hypothetical protein
MSQWAERMKMSTFSQMADQWMRENMPLVQTARPAAQEMAMHDQTAWAEDFHRWAITQCVFQDRCFGGVRALLRDFCDWQVMRDEVPCTRRTFEALLRDSGFFFADGLVYGLLLKADVLAIETERSGNSPSGSDRAAAPQRAR